MTVQGRTNPGPWVHSIRVIEATNFSDVLQGIFWQLFKDSSEVCFLICIPSILSYYDNSNPKSIWYAVNLTTRWMLYVLETIILHMNIPFCLCFPTNNKFVHSMTKNLINSNCQFQLKSINLRSYKTNFILRIKWLQFLISVLGSSYLDAKSFKVNFDYFV